MTIQPLLPASGYTGWRYLQRTLETQQSRMQSTAAAQRDEAYFREKIGAVTSAADLVADRRLLKVALGAFGLQDDLNSRYFIRKVLEEGTTASDSLANKLTDKSYAALSAAFGFDLETPNTATEGFADSILTKYAVRQFETAVGEQDDNLRLALNARRELGELASASSSDATKWYSIMGSSPLREVFETAFGLPSSFGSLDIDLQMKTLRERAKSIFGSSDIAQFTNEASVEKLVRTFLLRAQINEGVSTASSPALAILQAGQSTAGSILQLLIR